MSAAERAERLNKHKNDDNNKNDNNKNDADEDDIAPAPIKAKTSEPVQDEVPF